MSESEYRSAREAARARVATLEDELRKRKSLAAKVAGLSTAHDAEKKTIRARMDRYRKSRNAALASIFVVIAGFFLLMRAMASFQIGAAVVYVAFALMIGWVRVAIKARYRSREERDGEYRLEEISRQDEQDAQRFRVASSQIREQAHLEPADLEALENEIEEARMLADEEESAREESTREKS